MPIPITIPIPGPLPVEIIKIRSRPEMKLELRQPVQIERGVTIVLNGFHIKANVEVRGCALAQSQPEGRT